jgi:magnesium-transporting ATPase (P-type)
MSALESPDPWWLAPLPDVSHAGLASAEAAERLAEAGPNLLCDVQARSLLVDYLSRFRNPLDIVLLAASAAAARLLEADDFFVKQALLTGESYPIEKRCGALPPSATDLQDAGNAVFMGTSAISGSARVLVMKTVTSTAMGTIAGSLQRAPPTSFEVGTRRFGMLILRLSVTMVMFVLLESFLFAVALAVGLTPELLPMVVSVTLARGALRTAAQALIVKRMTAIQDLGSMSILCTDKTGTLTEAKMRLVAHVDAIGADSPRVLELAYLNSFFETGLKSPLDDAIFERLLPRPGSAGAAGAWRGDQGRHRGQRARDTPHLRAVAGSGGGRPDGAGRESVLPYRPCGEKSHHSRTQGTRQCCRLPGRRHRRRACAAIGRRRPVGGPGGRCRQGGG